MKIVIAEVKYRGHKFTFEFAITRYVFGFNFSTPNYGTGYRKNPINAIKSFMLFSSERDFKSLNLNSD